VSPRPRGGYRCASGCDLHYALMLHKSNVCSQSSHALFICLNIPYAPSSDPKRGTKPGSRLILRFRERTTRGCLGTPAGLQCARKYAVGEMQRFSRIACIHQ
jgi:hypothetical protein